MTLDDLDQVRFDKRGGLVPAVVQDARTRQVLMLAYMDLAALNETLESGEVTFFSRSRGGRWRKGETSGNRLKVRTVAYDCDADALLLSVDAAGPACHTGAVSCFTNAPSDPLALLERTIASRASADPAASGTARLLARGVKRVAQKVGEEGVETALAAAAGPDEEVCEEAADLLYHLLVLLHARGLTLEDVLQVLDRRRR